MLRVKYLSSKRTGCKNRNTSSLTKHHTDSNMKLFWCKNQVALGVFPRFQSNFLFSSSASMQISLYTQVHDYPFHLKEKVCKKCKLIIRTPCFRA